MKLFTFNAFAFATVLVLFPNELVARGFRGGGGGAGVARNIGGGGTRPAARPSVPNLGASRPTPSRPTPSRPNISTPGINRPAVNHPTTRPTAPSPPQANRPSGGLKPSTRPSLPASRPSLPTNRPTTNLPGSGNRLPRPETRPSIPGLGGTANRPNIRPPNVNLPGSEARQNLPTGGGGRPSAGDLGDFLGMDRPLKPSTLPGSARPGIDNGIANRLPNRPNGGNGIGNNVSSRIGDRNQVNIGQINIGSNNIISNRPTWANIDRGRVTNINSRWQNQIGGMHNWQGLHPNRAAYWAGWGAGVHSSYHWHYRHPGCFRGDWWYSHPHRWCGWHYGYGFYNRPWKYWWTIPTFHACVNWFTWTAPQTVWAQPVYYDYGLGGNVVYNDNSVYINGDQVATTTEFAQSAADLATVPAPASEEEAEKAEWLPLGTFAVSSGEKDVDPVRIVQLAVSKEGIISGTIYNTQTDEAQSIQGQVDKQTQRVAFRIGESEDLVIETGLYNLTQNEAPLLVHFGPDKVENWLLVRLEDPAPDDTDEADKTP